LVSHLLVVIQLQIISPHQVSSMSATKRKAIGSGSAPASKRAKEGNAVSGTDPATGQRNALPGLDDSDIEFEDDLSKDAMLYLRGVR